ncbi:pectate lyase [Streptomyces sp. NBC_01808]|uniref:pectate lyase family protein n=1 Tax=Streptomyces sp. NBC_01808 TaxID=2975947 RepID=UPI002DDAAA1A|nr:pectate lyase [Streptomyces sp. NBC_01808]WSA40197.1 pectate lyase [Streptomyces sp. NBC_01808]
MRKARTALMCAVALGAVLLPGPAAGAAADAPVGWAATGDGTTGGEGAPPESVHTVTTWAELKTAFDNGGDPDGPKVIQVSGAIDGAEAADGSILGEQDYAPGYDIDKFMACFGPDGTGWSDDAHPWCDEQSKLRQTGSNNQKAQIQTEVPSNTTIVGLGDDARLLGVYLSIRSTSNIVIRNLHFEAPVDYFTNWDPADGDDGAWNARFDALSMVTGRNVWIDHCTFSDGRFPDSEAPVGFHGERVQRHDGLLDMEDGTDLVTVSSSAFLGHDKTMLVGSGDGKGDRGHLRITYHGNLFDDSQQRSPRVRFGRVHVFNNYFTGATDDPDYPLVSQDRGGDGYFLGSGIESKIVSEYNAFEQSGPDASADVVLANWKGNEFTDRGSTFNEAPVDADGIARRKFEAARAEAVAEAEANGEPVPEWATREFTTDVGWEPSEVYDYRLVRDPGAVKEAVLADAGAGR